MDLIKLVQVEIGIIVQEQIRIVNYNTELEDRRRRLMEYVQSSTELDLSRGARENILENVSNMKMEISRTPKAYEQKRQSETVKRCRYDNGGYCKYQNRCKFKHFQTVCEMFLKDGKCEDKNCDNRHPKICRYWRDDKECVRNEHCKYLHKNSTVEEGESTSPLTVTDKVTNQNDVEMAESTEDTVTKRDEAIKELKDTIDNMKLDKEELKKQVERLNRVALNMHKELKKVNGK